MPLQPTHKVTPAWVCLGECVLVLQLPVETSLEGGALQHIHLVLICLMTMAAINATRCTVCHGSTSTSIILPYLWCDRCIHRQCGWIRALHEHRTAAPCVRLSFSAAHPNCREKGQAKRERNERRKEKEGDCVCEERKGERERERTKVPKQKHSITLNTTGAVNKSWHKQLQSQEKWKS